MKWINKLTFALVFLIFSVNFSTPKTAYAACVDMLDYFYPSRNGEVPAIIVDPSQTFYDVPSPAPINGRPGFYLVKSADGTVYEEFSWDSQYIYHGRDTSWATGPNQNVSCFDGKSAGFTMVKGNVAGCSDPNFSLADYESAPWVKRTMCEGEVMSSNHTIVGFAKDGVTCGCCEAPYTGNTSFGMRFNRLHPTYQAGGFGTLTNVVELEIIAGNGQGERFFLSKEYGHIGFIRPNGESNFISSITDRGENVKVCTFVENENGVLVCEGPLDTEHRRYITEIVGLTAGDPWRLTGGIKAEGDLDDLANQIKADLNITSTVYQHHDFSPIVNQIVGAYNDTNPDYDIDTRTKEFRPAPIFSSQIPGAPFLGSFDVSTQPSQQDGETPSNYVRRIIPGAGDEIGIKSEMPTNTIAACIQETYCNPKRGDTCLKVNYDPNACVGDDISACLCTENDDPENCIAIGRKLNFTGGIDYIEPPELHAMERVFLDLKRKLVSLPGKPDRYMTYALGEESSDQFANNNISTSESEGLKITAERSTSQESTLAAFTSPNTAEAASCAPNLVTPVIGLTLNPSAPSNSTGVFDVGYNVCTVNGNECNLGDLRVTVGGTTIGPIGTDTASGRCWQNGDGGLASFNNINLAGGSLTITAEVYGRRVGTNPSCHNEGCFPQTQSTSCTASSEFNVATGEYEFKSTCGLSVPASAPPVDCRVCESWVRPKGLCAGIDTNDLIVEDRCVKDGGSCNADGVLVESGIDYSQYEDTSLTFDLSKWPIIGPILANMGLVNIECTIGSSYVDLNAPCSADPSLSCNTSACQAIGGGHCPSYGTNTKCDWNQSEYLLYAYPTDLTGDLNAQRTSDMEVHNALFNIPAVTEEYFESESAKAPLTLTLGYSNVGHEEGKVADTVRFGVNHGLDRTIQVEYFDHYSQARMHCLKNKFLSLPNQLPLGQSELCRRFEFWGIDVVTANGSGKSSSNKVYNQVRPAKSKPVRSVTTIDNSPSNLTGEEVTTLRDRFTSDIEQLVNKHNIDIRNITKDNIPTEFERELRDIVKRYEQ